MNGNRRPSPAPLRWSTCGITKCPISTYHILLNRQKYGASQMAPFDWPAWGRGAIKRLQKQGQRTAASSIATAVAAIVSHASLGTLT